MKPQELRIGNWVIKSLLDGSLRKEYQIKSHDLHLWDQFIYESIQITEEWLERLPDNIPFPKWIKYIHQAQNWYYWNYKQEELKIKQYA